MKYTKIVLVFCRGTAPGPARGVRRSIPPDLPVDCGGRYVILIPVTHQHMRRLEVRSDNPNETNAAGMRMHNIKQ